MVNPLLTTSICSGPVPGVQLATAVCTVVCETGRERVTVARGGGEWKGVASHCWGGKFLQNGHDSLK